MPRILRIKTPNASIYAPGGGYWPPEAYGPEGAPPGVPTSTGPAGQASGLPLDIPAANYTGAPTYSDIPTGPPSSAYSGPGSIDASLFEAPTPSYFAPMPDVGSRPSPDFLTGVVPQGDMPGSMSAPGTSIGLPGETFGFDPTINWGDLPAPPVAGDIPGEPQVVTSQPSTPDQDSLGNQPIPAAVNIVFNQPRGQGYPAPGGGPGGPSAPDWESNAARGPFFTAPSVQATGTQGVAGQGGSYFTQSSSGPGFDVLGGIGFDPSSEGRNTFGDYFRQVYQPAGVGPTSNNPRLSPADWLSLTRTGFLSGRRGPMPPALLARGLPPGTGAGARHAGLNRAQA